MKALPKSELKAEQKKFATGERTRKLQSQQKAKMDRLSAAGEEEPAEERREYNRHFTSVRRQEYREHIESIAEAMAEAADAGNLKELSRQQKRLPGQGRSAAGFAQPTHCNKCGNCFGSVEDILDWWHSGMKDHWRPTDEEGDRPELEETVRAVRSKPIDLSDSRLDRVLRRAKEGKATGDDEVPAEFWEAVDEARRDLYTLIRRIFNDQAVPDRLVTVLFVMIYKGAKKGSVNQFEAYRPIGLMRHAWKIFEMVFVEELAEDTHLFLEPSQEGSRPARGARSNILRARVFIDVTLALGWKGVMTLLDYSGAFDATSRKFLDESIIKAGARQELVEIYRSAMNAAVGQVKMKRADGSVALSAGFDLGRGGIQGGMSTPWIFILATTAILEADESRRHDLDYAIWLECLRREVERRDTGQYTVLQHAAEDDGQQRWDAAVKRGADAMLAARD